MSVRVGPHVSTRTDVPLAQNESTYKRAGEMESEGTISDAKLAEALYYCSDTFNELVNAYEGEEFTGMDIGDVDLGVLADTLLNKVKLSRSTAVEETLAIVKVALKFNVVSDAVLFVDFDDDVETEDILQLAVDRLDK
jgi:hypothetical protein